MDEDLTESDSELVEVLREQLARTWEQLEAELEASRESRRIIAGIGQCARATICQRAAIRVTRIA